MGKNFTKYNEDSLKKVLFINYGGIGDEILFLPVLQTFKKCYPGAHITLCLEPRSKSVKDLTSLISEVVTVDIKAKGFKKYFNVLNMIFTLRNKKFDAVISSGKSPLVAVILFLTGIRKRVGYKSKTAFLLTDAVQLNENQYAGAMYHDLIKPLCNCEYDETLHIPRIETDSCFDLPNDLKGKNFVAVHPGVSKMSIAKNILKCPNASFWHEVIKKVLDNGKNVVLFGGADDEIIVNKILSDNFIVNHPNFINFYLKTKSLKEMANILSYADALICADSAPLHVGVSLNLKNIICIFGPTNEKKLVPDRPNIKIVKNEEIDCRPCLWHKRMTNCGHSRCLDVKSDDVIKKLG